MGNGVNTNNLIAVVTTSFPDNAQGFENRNSTWIKCTMANVRSLKSKEVAVFNCMLEEKIDLMLLVETWLKENDDDNIWNKVSVLLSGNFSMNSMVRNTNNRGGGLALVSQNSVKVTLEENSNANTFEYAVWNIMIDNTSFQIMKVYHPPSEVHKHMNQQFLDELIEVYATLSVRHLNLIVMGDFIVHYLMEKDDSEQFKDMMEAVGLVQKVMFDMHVMGNILDLIFIEQEGNIKISNVREGLMFSDHKSVECEIEIQKPEISKQSKMFRNWKKGDATKFCYEFNLEELDYSVTDLETFWNSYSEKLENTVNAMVPEKTIKITSRDSQPWYD